MTEDFTEEERRHLKQYREFSKKLRAAERKFREGDIDEVFDRINQAKTVAEQAKGEL